MDKQFLINHLNLAQHIEGGYFVRTYQSASQFNQRQLMTSIYYLLTNDRPIGYFHCNKSDIMHYFHLGAPIKYFTISPDGELASFILGTNLAAGQVLQQMVPGGYWKASFLAQGEFGLLSEAVSPGFEYKDMIIGSPAMLKTQFPQLWQQIAAYVKPSDCFLK